jgi:hypothetical protein
MEGGAERVVVGDVWDAGTSSDAWLEPEHPVATSTRTPAAMAAGTVIA